MPNSSAAATRIVFPGLVPATRYPAHAAPAMPPIAYLPATEIQKHSYVGCGWSAQSTRRNAPPTL